MDTFLVILIIIIFPFFIWFIGYVNTWFFVPFFKEEEAKDFLKVHGCKFIESKEVKDDGRYKIEDSLINRFYSYKTYYNIEALSITDGTNKKFRLILKKSFAPFGYKRKMYFFEE